MKACSTSLLLTRTPNNCPDELMLIRRLRVASGVSVRAASKATFIDCDSEVAGAGGAGMKVLPRAVLEPALASKFGLTLDVPPARGEVVVAV